MRIRGNALCAAVAVALTATGAGTHAATASDEIVAYTADGSRVTVGTVMVQGVTSDRGCLLPGPVVLRVATSGAIVRMTTTPDCAVVVTDMGMDDRPLTRDVPKGVPYVGLGDAGDRSATNVTGYVTEPAPAAAGGNDRTGIVWQEVSDKAGNWYASAQFKVDFTRGATDGALRNASAREPECPARTFPVASTDARSCRRSLPSRGPDFVDLDGTGEYAYTVLMQDVVVFRLGGRFMGYRDTRTTFIGTCVVEVVSGLWPQGWSTDCSSREQERTLI